jgi:hypothetical protein
MYTSVDFTSQIAYIFFYQSEVLICSIDFGSILKWTKTLEHLDLLNLYPFKMGQNS